MVDLNVYRVRIGTFQNKCHKTKSRRTLFQSKMSPHQHSVGRGSRLRTLVLLWVMTAAVVVCIPLLHQERDSAVDETLHPAVRTNREQLNQVTDPLISCLWKVYHSIISGYRNGWLTLKPSAVSCDSIIDSYKNGWMTLPPSAVSCDSVIHNYTNGWMTLPPSGVSCDSVIDNYTNRWMTLPPSVVFYDSVVDNYTNGWMTLSPSTFSCDSVVDNYTNRWMTLPPSPVSCDSIIDNYTNGWMTLSPSALSYGSTVDNYTNRWMTLPPSAVSCDSVVDNYANRWMTLSPSAVSCDSVVDNYTNRWMTLPPSAVSCNSVIDNYTNRWMTLPPSPVSCDSDVDNYTNRWMTLPPSAAFLENDMCPITEKQSKKTCSYLIGNAGIHAYNGNPPMHGGAEKEVHMLHCEMVIKLSDLVHPGMGNFWEKFVFMLEVYLTSEEISGANNIFKVCKTLETKGIIKHGQYGVLKQLFASAGLKQCCEIVEEYSLKIEGTRRKALPLCTAETLFSQNAAETIHNQDTAETVHSQDTTDTVHSQGTAESLRSQATTETVHRQDTAEKVHSQATAERVHSQDTAETMHSQDTAETVHSQATAETVHSQATADTVHSQDTAETVHSQDTAETVHSQDTAETVHSQDTAERVHSQDTAETVHSQDTTDTVHSQDTAETVHSQDTAETVHSQDTTESVFSQDTGETRFHQNKVPSVSRKRRRETSPQQGSSSVMPLITKLLRWRQDSEKKPREDDLPIELNVVSQSPPSSDNNAIYEAMMNFLLSVLDKILTESETTEEMLTRFDEWLLRFERVTARRKCLMIYVACGSRIALNDLWQMYRSGELLEILQNGLITRDLLAKCGMESIQLGVFISEEDYERCLRNIAEPVTTEHAVTTDHAVTTTRQAIDARGYKLETGEDGTDTEMKSDITETVGKQDIRVTEDINSDKMQTEENPDIMGTEISDTRDTENIQPGIMGIETKQDTRDTEDTKSGNMEFEETKHDTGDTEDIQPDIMGIKTKQDIRDTEDTQPGIMGIETKQDTREIEDTTAGECSMDTPLFKKGNTMDTAVEKEVTETGQDFKEWVPPTAGIAAQVDVKGEELRTFQEDVVDVLAQHAAGFGAAGAVYSRDTAGTVYSRDTAETLCSRDTAASSHKMPSGTAGTVYSQDTAKTVYSWDTAKTMFHRETAASSRNKMPSVDMEASVKVWGDNDKLCYETKGIKDVLQKICSEEHNYICVVGEPGCGKSTAIRHAALYLKDKLGFIIYPVSGPKQFVDYLDPDKPQVGVIDDIIGEYFIDQDKLKLWDEYNEKIKDWLQVHKNTKVLFSLRVQLHSELKSKGNTHIYNDQRHVINFSDKEYKLSRDTMQDMLRHYLQVQHVQNIEGLIRRVWWERAEQFAGCFPLLCKVFSEDESVRVDPKKYFSHPWPALQNIFKQIKSKNKHQFCGLLLCGITDLKDEYFSPLSELNKPKHFNLLIKSQKLDPDTDLDDIKQALNNLDGVYISHIGNRYTFLHSIFQNIVTFLYDDKYYVFKYATLDFIHKRVRLFSKFDTDNDYVKVFYGDDCVELLVDRIIEELRSDRWRWWEGANFIVRSHYIDNKGLITCLMEKLFDSKHKQITQDKIDWLFGRCLETVCYYTRSPPHTDVTSCPQYQLLLSLIARCDCNKQIEVLWWPEYPLLYSVYRGSLPVTKVLVEHQADVNVVDRYYKRCVLHWAVVCDNNVDMTKYLLSLPNLKCLNHRDDRGHTPYWYVVNNKSPTEYRSDNDVPHRDELMKLYKHTAAICE